MKIFVLKGPVTSKHIQVEDDEMIEWRIIKIADYEARNPKKKWNSAEWYDDKPQPND